MEKEAVPNPVHCLPALISAIRRTAMNTVSFFFATDVYPCLHTAVKSVHSEVPLQPGRGGAELKTVSFVTY